ncbi:MAG: enterotoxin, partial [Prevotella sp.]|nr:enterotoxin [Prevotella sp.]
TKDNPVPVFWHKFVSGKVNRKFNDDGTPYDRSTKSIPYFDVQDDVTAEANRLFVTEYLTRIIDKDELVRLFGEK